MYECYYPGMAFSNGQRVLVRRRHPAEGTIERVRPGDLGMPAEQRLYSVRIPETTEFYLATDLEAIPDTPKKLVRGSDEWMAELEKFQRAAAELTANPNNKAAQVVAAAAVERLGFVKAKQSLNDESS